MDISPTVALAPSPARQIHPGLFATASGVRCALAYWTGETCVCVVFTETAGGPAHPCSAVLEGVAQEGYRVVEADGVHQADKDPMIGLTITTAELAERLGSTLEGDGSRVIPDVSTVEEAQPEGCRRERSCIHSPMRRSVDNRLKKLVYRDHGPHSPGLGSLMDKRGSPHPG